MKIPGMRDNPEPPIELDKIDGLTDIKEVEYLIQAEAELWQKQEIDPSMIVFHIWKMDRMIYGILEVLIDKGIFTQEELELKVNKLTLRFLIEQRPALAAEVRKAKILSAGIMPPDGNLRGLN